MKRRIIIIAVFTLSAFGLIGSAKYLYLVSIKAQQSNVPPPWSLDWYVQKAQSQNSSTISFNAGTIEYVQPETWDEAVNQSSILRVRLMEAKSYPSVVDNGQQQIENGIMTWYKFKVLEQWSQKPPCDGCLTDLTPPSDMLPLNYDEILIPKEGGTLQRNGITLTSIENDFVDFFQSPYYQDFVILVQLNPDTKIATFWMGQNSVITVFNNEQEAATYDFWLAQTDPQPRSPYSNELRTRYGATQYGFSYPNFRASLYPQ